MSVMQEEMLNMLSRVLSIVPREYVCAIFTLHQKLDGKGITWILNGDLGECLRTVQVKPDCIEIVCSKEDGKRIFQAVEEFKPTPVSFKTNKLPRSAMVEGRELPVYVRSHCFEFKLNNIMVKIQGDLQFKVGNWDWGDVFLFNPEYVYVVGKKIAVTPLSVKSQLYLSLGWTDRVEKIKQVAERPFHRG